MKQLKCEMCGGTDLIKQDGVFVCQSCGCKYSVEEAKKMMVEGTVEVQGTVKIDNSDKLANLYEVARRARDSGDYENAVKFYQSILEDDPRSWEAAFYNVFSRAMQTNILNIASAADSITNCLPQIFTLIMSLNSDVDSCVAVAEISLMIFNACETFYQSALSHFKQAWDATETHTETCFGYFREYTSRITAISQLLMDLGNHIETNFGNNERVNKFMTDAWMKSIQYYRNHHLFYDDPSSAMDLFKKYEAKIVKIVPDYKIPAPNTRGLPDYIRNEILEKYQKERQQEKTASSYGDPFIRIPMAGKILQIYVQEGQQIQKNDELLVFFANGIGLTLPVVAPESGTIEKILVKENALLDENDIIIKMLVKNQYFIANKSVSSIDIEKIELLINKGDLINAIKYVREISGLPLADAKYFVDNFSTMDMRKPQKFSAQPTSNNSSGGGCYVATCVYGSYDCPQVWTLRRYRDNTLASTWYGRAFIRTYYAISPTIVKWFGNTQWFKNLWKNKLDKMVFNLRSNGVEDTPYQDKDWR